MKTIIVYASKHGFVREAAERVRDGLDQDVEMVDIFSGKVPDLTDFDTILFASSVHIGQFSGKFKKICRNWIPRLSEKKVLLLVGGLGDKEYEQTALKNLGADICKGIRKTYYAGARFLPEQHNFFIRRMIAKINQSEEAIHKEKWENLEQLVEDIKSP